MENNIPAVIPEYESRNPVVRWLFDQRLKKAASYAAIIDPSSLIDIGCGDGAFLGVLQKSRIKTECIWGIDLNSGVVDLTHKYPNCFFKKESILKTGFGEGSFNLAVCLDTLEHIGPVESALTEIKRITSKKGWLITSQPTETVFYKLCRYLLKGTFSGIGGPAAGVHWHSAAYVDMIIRKVGYELIESCQLPLSSPFDLFHINLYRKG